MNIRIRDIAVTSGRETVKNNYFIDRFKKEHDRDIGELLNNFGKNERRIIGKKEDTTISLAINVAKKIMKRSGLTGEDIDMIIFSSQFPEYTVPTQALIIHKAINGKKGAFVMDMNVNCLGMVAAVDTTIRYLKDKIHFKRALVIGSDYMTVHCKQYDSYTFPMFGDSACALILEKTDEPSRLIGSSYKTNSEQCQMVKYPACGLSSLYSIDNKDDMRILWNPFNADFVPNCAKEAIYDVLIKHNLKISDIDLFCVSQFALPMLKEISKVCEVDEEKFIYIGDKYGYTGTSSPFIALYEAIKQGRVKRGDYIVFWSVAVYWTSCALVIRY